jgi:hypothetical protein
MATIDNTPVAALGLAAVLFGANPKHLLLAVSGAAAIAQTGIPGGQQAIAYLIFALICTLGRRHASAVAGNVRHVLQRDVGDGGGRAMRARLSGL